MNRNRHIGVYLKSVALVGGLLFFACTQDEEIATNKVIKSDIVTFGFGTSNEWKPDVVGGDDVSSRSRTQALPMDCEGGSLPDEIYMYMLEEDCPTEVDTVSVKSRGADGEETTSTPAIGIFAFQVPGEESATAMTYGPEGCNSVLMNNIDATTYTNNVYWPGGGYWLQFYAYQPYCGTLEGLALEADDYNPTFTYNVPTDVTKQSDLMVGAPDEGMLYGTYCQEVAIELKHILSKIQVKVGNIPSGVVKSVTLEGIQSSGTYSFVGKDPQWNIDNTVDATTYSYDFGNDGQLFKSNAIIGQPFHLLPQTLSDNAIIKIVLGVTTPNPNSTSDNDKTRYDEYTLTKKLKDFKASWSKDKQYTYVITTPQHVDVEVTDKVEGNVKKDLVIKNTGMSPAYIRAAITGNWIRFQETSPTYPSDGSEIISKDKLMVAEWSEEIDVPDNEKKFGTFNWGNNDFSADKIISDATPSTTLGNLKDSWIKCSDGYYYWTSQLQPGEELSTKNSNALFESYTLSENYKNYVPNDAVLELIISVQAVYPDDLELLWSHVYGMFSHIIGDGNEL